MVILFLKTFYFETCHKNRFDLPKTGNLAIISKESIPIGRRGCLDYLNVVPFHWNIIKLIKKIILLTQ